MTQPGFEIGLKVLTLPSQVITILVVCIAIALCDPIKEEVASVAASKDEQPADTQTQSVDDSDDMERSETIFAKKFFRKYTYRIR